VWVSFANGKEEIHKCIPDQERGRQEVQRLREVQDIPGCVEVLGYNVTKHWVIIEMPATKSKDLMDMVLKLQHLESLEKFNGLFFYVVRSLVETIARMHEKHISHGDINSENLLVNLDVIVSTIWIDFSSSQQTTAEELVQTDEYGTTEFMAPEVFNRLPHNPMKADVFSLGVLLYSLFFGRFPQFSPSGEVIFKNIRQLNKQIFDHLEMKQLMQSMMSYSPTASQVFQTLVKHAPDFLLTKRKRKLDFTLY
jgi:serine/threonine protein kinase